MNTDRKRPLGDGDSLVKTNGCRHSQPNICRENGKVGVCAFVTKDGWCLSPPKSWPKLYAELKRGSRDDSSQ